MTGKPRLVIKVRAAHVSVVRITGQWRLRACSTGCGYGSKYCVEAGPLRDRCKPKYDFPIQVGGVLGDQLQAAARVAHERLRELFKLRVNSIQPITPRCMSRVGRCTWTVAGVTRTTFAKRETGKYAYLISSLRN
jgi:hypothetical protein